MLKAPVSFLLRLDLALAPEQVLELGEFAFAHIAGYAVVSAAPCRVQLSSPSATPAHSSQRISCDSSKRKEQQLWPQQAALQGLTDRIQLRSKSRHWHGKHVEVLAQELDGLHAGTVCTHLL